MIQPHLWADDLDASISWHREVLGFEVTNSYPEGQPTWVEMTRGTVAIMIANRPSELAPNQEFLAGVVRRTDGGAIALYLHVDSADAVYGAAVEAGAEVVEEIWDAWWGGRQFSVMGPDNILWTVFQPSS